MPLSSTRLRDDVISRLEGDAAIPFVDDALSTAVIGHIVAAIVDELQANADVTITVPAGVTVSVDPTTGVGATTSPGNGTGGIA